MAQFDITNAYIAVGGHQATPKISEAFDLVVEFDVQGTPTAPYVVRFTVAGQVREYTETSLTPGHRTLSMYYTPLPLDGDMPWKVHVDPDHVTSTAHAGAAKSGSFEPVAPHAAIEYYDPIYVHGQQQWGVDVTGSIGNTKAMIGRPSSQVWQKVLNQSSFAYRYIEHSNAAYRIDPMPERKVDNAGKYEVYFWNKTEEPTLRSITIGIDFDLELQNVRVNADKLRTVTWHDLSTISDSVHKFYQQPEDIVQSNSPKISTFVKNQLGDNFKSQMSPYEAARKLFCAVLKRCTYYFPAEGDPDLRKPDAIGMLEQKFGDCGGFSLLLVALFRNIGFPSRTSCGCWIGGGGHCWCELYFPGHGWIVADGSAGNSLSEDGRFAYCFGNQDAMNSRLALMRGNTFNIGNFSTDWLQGPDGPWPDGAATMTAAPGFPNGVWTSVVEVDPAFVTTSKTTKHEPSAKAPVTAIPDNMLAKSAAAELRLAASKQCPCSHHGGFRLSSAAVQKVAESVLPKA